MVEPIELMKDVYYLRKDDTETLLTKQDFIDMGFEKDFDQYELLNLSGLVDWQDRILFTNYEKATRFCDLANNKKPNLITKMKKYLKKTR